MDMNMGISNEDDFSMLGVIEPPIYGVTITNNQALDLVLNNSLAATGVLETVPGTIPPPLPKTPPIKG